MPLQFGLADYESPKIEIIGKEVPLAAMEKTGAVLQDRYDKAYENETKTQALMRKLMQDVNEEDKEVAQQVFDAYNKRLSERTEKGDFHNMRWETLRDAQDFANTYTSFAEKAKKLQEYKDKISTYDKIEPERRAFELKKWLSSQKKASFDPESRIATGFAVNAPSLTDDVDMAKFFDTYAKGIEEDLTSTVIAGTKIYKAGEKMLNGQTAPTTGFYDIKTGRKVTEVKEDDVAKILKGYLSSDPQAQSYLRAMKEFYIDKYNITPEQAGEAVSKKLIDKGIGAAAKKYGFLRKENIDESTLNASATGSIGTGPAQNPNELYSPGSLNAAALGNGTEFDSDLASALSGNTDSFNTISEKLNALEYLHKNNPDMLHNIKNMKIVTNLFEQLYQTNPELLGQAQLSVGTIVPGPDGIGYTAGRLKGLIESNINYSTNQKNEMLKKLNVIQSLSKNIITNPLFDTISEDTYENFNNVSNRKVAMASFDMNSAAARNMKNNMVTDLNISDFNVIGPNADKFGKNPEVTIQKFSTESLGSGRGVVFQALVKDNNGDPQVVQLSPKNRTQGRHLIKEFSKHVYAPLAFNDRLTKGINFYENGQTKTVGQILKQNNDKLLNSWVNPKEHKDVKITYKDGLYYLGNDPTGYSSPNQAIYTLVDKTAYNKYLSE